MESAVASVSRRFDLSHAGLNALAVIEGAGGPLSAGDVGTRMHITSGTVTTLLDNLERKGYVERTADRADRRRVLVDITPKAQDVLDRMLPEVQQLATHAMSTLGPNGQRDLLDALAKVRTGLDELPSELPPAPERKRPKHLTRKR